jgi:hypothetical protein
MKGILVTAGAALLVAVPAAMGLVGNTSFAQSVPVRVPAQARVLYDDHGGQRPTTATEPGDDHGGQRPTTATEPGDDHGGQRATSTTKPPSSTTRPGDDHGGQRPTTATGRGKVLSNSTSGKGQNGGGSGRSGGRDASPGHR